LLPHISVRQSVISALLLLCVAISLAGTQALAFWIPSAEAAGEDAATEEQEQQALQRLTVRKSQARGKKTQSSYIKLSAHSGAPFGAGSPAFAWGFLSQSVFCPGPFNLLQVFRV
jgi:hypothetical protein